MDEHTRGVTPRRRQWGVEPRPASDEGRDHPWTSAEERAAARRILWRDSATILVGVILALLAFQMFLRGGGGGGPASDGTGLPSGLIVASGGTSRSAVPGQTFGPILDPSLGIDTPPTKTPARTLPPTGSQRPATPAPNPTPRPTPRLTPRPPTPAPTASPTQPPPTEPPPTAPPPTEPPPTEPPPTEPPPTEPPPTEPPPTDPPPTLPPSPAALR